ncbi:polysaccharide biosynthesis protein GumB [Novosphingobium fuchskuhlense]|uniref:Polysaccharide biosynthesis protein GumB n=1 Tax=Novosphingobium fuchskuhlense TaxID=1117702 RepID=A0A117UZN1_9SPHN|nr:polysaccharide biosynthesis protein GumB [Novosphingobium fuchskuhlense]
MAAHVLLSVSLAITGCSSQLYSALPVRDAAYAIMPPIDKATAPDQYLITPGDIVSLAVFGEPELTLEKLPVDDAGFIQVPLIGPVAVAKLTPAQASTLIATKLGARYLRNPGVTLNVVEQTGQVVTVEGQVLKAGSYPIDGQTTLLGAIALAQSPTRIAKLNEVVVFRTINNQRMAARFDLARIRAGRDPDPQILGGDVVVVGFSQAKSIYRDVLTAAPLFNVFTRF